MAKEKPVVIAQYPFVAIKKRYEPKMSGYSYDMWEWNVWKMKWVRLHKTACGFGDPPWQAAKERSDEIEQMIKNNQSHPALL